MDKSNDVKIYSLCYKKKDFEFIDDSVVTPLQVGAAVSDEDVCEVKDNTGDNISSKNLFYVECTGTYWIWKNVHSKYKGQMQYRRPLSGVNETFDFEKAFSEYDVITMDPFDYLKNNKPTDTCPYFIPADNVFDGYCATNSAFDMARLEDVISTFYPGYVESFEKYIKKGSMLYYSNGFIMKEEDYDKYAQFLFNVLKAFRERYDITTDESLWFHVGRDLGFGGFDGKYGKENRFRMPFKDMRYQTSIGGFLSERIFTLWLLHNFDEKKILKIPYDKQEKGMWI